MSKSTKNTSNTSNTVNVADLQKRIDELEIENQDLMSRLANAIEPSKFVQPGEFATLKLPANFSDHDTRASLLNASESASDKISAADTLLGIWRWISDPTGLRPTLREEIGKDNGIDSPLGETIQAIRKATRAFAGASKKRRDADRVKAAEAKVDQLAALLKKHGIEI